MNASDIRSVARALTLVRLGATQPLGLSNKVNSGRIGLRVLVAEDNPINRAILQEQLEALGASVLTAEDGEEALLRWSPQAFDLVITDINMPRMNGYEFTHALRKQGAQIPIIGVTANALREEGEQCLAAGMNAWVVKPLSLDILRQTVLGHCGYGIAETRHESALQEGDMQGWIQFSASMRQLFIVTMQDDIHEVEQGLDHVDTARVVRHLHRMNGSLASVSARALSAACNEWEVTLQEKLMSDASTLQVRALLRRLKAVLDALQVDPGTDEPSSKACS